jgi:two-component system, NarL family, sensor kinase
MRFCKLNSILLLISTFFSYTLSAQNLDSLKRQTLSKVDTLRFSAYSDLVWELKDADKPNALNYAKALLTEAKTNGSQKWISQAYNDVGICNIRTGNLNEALSAFQSSLLIRRKLNNKKDIVSSLSKIANIYTEQLEYQLALNSSLEAITLCNAEKLLSQEGILTDNIAVIYYNLNAYSKSISYSQKALKIHEQTGYEAGKAFGYSNIGGCYDDLGKYDSAFFYLNKAKAILFKQGSYNEYCTTVNNLGLVYRKTKQTQKGIACYKEAIEISKEIGDTSGFLMYQSNLAATLIETMQLDESERMYLDVLQLAQTKQLNQSILKSYKGLVSLYTFKKNTFKADSFLQLYLNLKDTLFTRDFAQQFSEVQTKYDVSTKDLTITKNELEIAKQKQQNTFKNWLVLSLILLLLIAFIFFKIIQRSSKVKQQFKQQQLINETAFNSEQAERERIARDLHDSVGQKLSVVKMQLSMKTIDKEASSNLLDEAIQDVRNVSHNLMPADLNKGLLIALENMCEQINFSSTTLKVHLNKTEAINHLSLDKQHTLLIYRMVQELVNNAIKYAQAKNIHINMDCEKNQLKLNLTDDGVGFDTSTLDKKEGIGIKNIKERVQQLIGTIQLTSKKGDGTQFKISIPI